MKNSGKAYLVDGSIINIYNKWSSSFSHNPSLFVSKNANINNILIHRKNGPAIIFNNDLIDKYIFIQNGNKHRLDGPSECNDSYFDPLYSFYINGNQCLPSLFAEKTNHLICWNCNKFCKQGCF